MKIVVTGGMGFVASNVSESLCERGHDVTVVDSMKFGNEKNKPKNCEILRKDISECDEPFFRQFDTVVACHCSNIIYAIEYPIETIKNNAVNTLSMFAKFNGKIVYTSTTSIYGQAEILPTPENSEVSLTNAYDTSKYIGELYLKERGNYTTLRLSNVYGKNQRPENKYAGIISKFIENATNYQDVNIYGDGTSTRDYTYIQDTCDAIVKAVEMVAFDTEINISTGIEKSVVDVSEEIFKQLNLPQRRRFVGERVIDKISRRCIDNSKAKRLLGWSPKISFDEGISKTINWMKNEKQVSV